MPNVAQKLCNDIVEPTVKKSTNDGRVITRKFRSRSSASTRNDKAPRFINIDRQVTNSKSKTLDTDGITILKSKTGIRKSLAETAVNTLVSGPLKCDNNCMTLVRKRDFHNSCKCGHKRPNTKTITKSIQTLGKDFSRTDKACIHCVETATCGTQLFNKNTSILGNENIISMSKRGLTSPGAGIKPGLQHYANIKSDSCQHNFIWTGSGIQKYLSMNKSSCPQHFDNRVKASSFRFVTAKRWDLTRRPTRGPDF